MESASSQQQLSLSDLPIGTLSHVSSYLPSSLSRALFAVALNYRDIDSSTAIVGDQRDVLDFGDIEKELAAKLTDHDVRNILLSIDAFNKLKALRLTNLLNITGIGLEPLRGSTKIEKIDLSLVRDNESPDLSPAPPISCTEVLLILDSIIHMGGLSSLKLLIFPEEWRKERNTDSEFHALLDRYNALLRTRAAPCLKCDTANVSMLHMGCNNYGTRDGTCYDCLKHYCLDCVEDEDGEEIYCMSMLCGNCNRCYCFRCSRAEYCNSCDEWFCVDCMDTKQCAHCEEITCLDCISEQKCRNNCCEEKIWCNDCAPNNFTTPCENCGTNYCSDCNDGNTDDVHSIGYCGECNKNLCCECRLIKSKEEMTNYCMGCHNFILNKKIQENERQAQEMQAEIKRVRNEINQLKRKAKDVKGELGDNNDS